MLRATFSYTDDLTPALDELNHELNVMAIKPIHDPVADDFLDANTNTPAVSMDDILDAVSNAPAAKAKAPTWRKPAANTTTPDGYTPIGGGNNTYHAREALKNLGGYWDAPAKRWMIPERRLQAALDAITNASRVQRELNAAEVAAVLGMHGVTLKHPPPKDAANILTTPQAGACWECGGSLYETRSGNRMRPSRWQNIDNGERLMTLRGAEPANYYCGCGARGDMHKRHRPSFR